MIQNEVTQKQKITICFIGGLLIVFILFLWMNQEVSIGYVCDSEEFGFEEYYGLIGRYDTTENKLNAPIYYFKERAISGELIRASSIILGDHCSISIKNGEKYE